MKHYIHFSVGDYELANFAELQTGAGGTKFYSASKKTPSPNVYGPPRSAKPDIYGPPRSAKPDIYGPPRSAKPSGTGIRKAHTRTSASGKTSFIGQSLTKIGKGTRGALSATKKFVGLKAAQGAGIAATAGGLAAEAVKNNPKTSALAAGGAAVVGGGGYLLTRKKRKRR